MTTSEEVYDILQLMKMRSAHQARQNEREFSRYQAHRRKMATRKSTRFSNDQFNVLNCFFTDPLDIFYNQVADVL